MRNGMMLAVGAGALVLIGGAAIAMSQTSAVEKAGGEKPSGVLAALTPPPKDCSAVATEKTGFDPATTPVPVREDAGNKQVLKGTAVGAAVGAIAGEVIGGKPGLGAAAGAGAGAAGGQAIKVDKQHDADARYEAAMASYQQQKAAYDAALQSCLG